MEVDHKEVDEEIIKNKSDDAKLQESALKRLN